MELRQLRTFVAIAEEQSFTRAADRLYLVQSAVSASLQTLERELGTTLIDRGSHPVSLTDAGRALLDEARKTLAAAEAAVDAVDQVRGGLRGTVELGIMQRRQGSHESVAQFIRVFGREHPAVRLVVRHAGEAQIRVEALADAVFADVPPSWGTRIALEAALARAQITREVRYEINDMASVVDFVEQDLAVAVLPPSYVSAHPDIRIVPIADGPAFVVSLATPTSRAVSAASAALAQIITGAPPAA